MGANVLRVALVIGALIDFFVAIVVMFFPQASAALFDIPAQDPTAALLGGGELLVAGFLYVFILRDTERFRPLLWLVALDQLFAALLPGIEVLRGHLPATLKIIAPMPISLALAAVYVLAARKPQS
jgi:hypothetical protein